MRSTTFSSDTVVAEAHAVAVSGLRRVAGRMLLGAAMLPALAWAQDRGLNGASSVNAFRTPEYFSQWALDNIHAADAYAMGYTGKGVLISVLDSGAALTHPEFAGRAIPGYDAWYGRPAGLNDLAATHSTAVAGIAAAARDGVGMHGVAYDATVLPIRVWHDHITEKEFRVDSSATARAIRHAVDRGAAVINGSYGVRAAPNVESMEEPGKFNVHYELVLNQFLAIDPNGTVPYGKGEADALRYAVEHGTVAVFAAGNDSGIQPIAAAQPYDHGLLPFIRPSNHRSGVYQFIDASVPGFDFENPATYVPIDPAHPSVRDLDYSDLEGAMIVVVATDHDNVISWYSNGCGVTWRWCMAAPGGGESEMVVPRPDGSYVEGMGTSYAAPMVAGSAALLRQAFPYMTARQIIELLLTSTDRSLHLGDRAIYGRGLLDLRRAIRGPVEFGAEGFASVFDVDTQGRDSLWSNDIGGTGGLIKRGAGTLALTGHNLYTGPTTVKGGTLAVYGSSAMSALTVERGGTLSGTGTVGTTQVSGTVAPGNPGAALRVAGDYIQRAEGVYVAGISVDGASSDLIEVRGTAHLENATLRVEGIGLNAVNREYTVLQADGGIQGGFAKVPDPYLFLDLQQGVRADDRTRYQFSVRRNATSFDVVARTPNQRAVARALDTAGMGLAPYEETVMATRTDGLARRFDGWSGEAHASTMTFFGMQSEQVRDGALTRARTMREGNDGMLAARSQAVVQEGAGKAVWAEYTGARERLAGDGNAAGLRASSAGLLFGTDMPVTADTRAGAMAGFANGDVSVDDRDSRAKVDSYVVGGYGDTRLDMLRVRYGASYAWHSVAARRDIGEPETAEGRYKAETAQVFAEAGLPYTFSRATIEPYVGTAYVDTRRRAFDESGNAGLHADAARQRLGFSTIGLRGGTSWDMKDGSRIGLHGGAGWRHAYGGVKPDARLRFAQGESFEVTGTPVARDALLLEAGASVRSERGMRLGVGYSGQLARGAQSHAIKANAAWTF